ncbi:MAG: hypothetical protein RH981_07110 [Arenibacter sp.]
MKRFIKNIIVFIIFGLLIGEFIARWFALSSDIPNRTIDRYGIQKYIPNQHGTWKGGTHTWHINEKGWPGYLPKSNDNLITIIGDSFIENFMNPEECHQSVYLGKILPKYNYFEASRSGISFIEAMEISKQLDTLGPRFQVIHLHDSDLEESIMQLKKHNDITQLDVNKQKIIFGKMNSPGLKKILYNWKFMYYLYRRFPIWINKPNKTQNSKITLKNNKEGFNFKYYKKLLEYIVANYNIDDKILVFRPESTSELVKFAKDFGFKTIQLKTDINDHWSFEHDSHWTCYGHEKVAEQVAEYLKSLIPD